MNNIKNHFTLKLVFTFFLFGLTLLFVAFAIIFKLNEERINKDIKSRAELVYSIKKSLFDTYIEEIDHKLTAVIDSKIFNQYIANNNDVQKKAMAKELLLNITESSHHIMQLRYIDKDGMEIIRVDRSSYNKSPYLAPEQILQNKEHRYYFKKSMDIAEGKVWYSKIDLNMEYNEIEIPIKPVLRVAMPVFKDGLKEGVIILNIFMKEILQKIVSSSSFDVFLLDRDGYILVSSLKDLNWNKYIDIGSNNPDEFLKQKDNLYSYDIDFKNDEGLKMVLHHQHTALDDTISEHLSELIMALIGLLIISVPLSILFSRYPIKVQNELHKLNLHLEDRIQKAVMKSKEEEKLLLQQSKLAILGEMVSMIAHQWRQPLGSINSVVGSIKVKIALGNLDHDMLEQSMDKIEKIAIHLSSTIDTFRNFYKPQNKQTECLVNSLVENALVIINDCVNESDIKISKSLKSNSTLLIYENEIINVILNLCMNAREVLVDKDIKDKLIQINTYDEDGMSVIEVSDNGGGIEEDIIDKIFDPYFSTKDV
ncbi:MAG: sensor histidine kinase, partial [Sulfurimonas sp.]|nr:sensor histidine kinase [Sulfurimonas sp.]